jgi:hypothetical protein
MSTFRVSTTVGTILVLLAISASLEAQMVVGTWVRTPTKTAPGAMTMTVEPCCGSGYKLTYRFAMGADKTVMTVSSPFDGTEVPVMVNDKPSGETMAIKRLDGHHSSTVIKMNGEPFGTSSATLSADGKTLTVINEMASGAAGKVTETWTKQ